jgi:hypothetical protein
MKKINLNKIVLTFLISVSALTANAQWAASVTAGSADYEVLFTQTYTNPASSYSTILDDSFLYRDLGIDYSFGPHQVGVKFGGLANEPDAVNKNDTSSANRTLSTLGGAERDEYSVFYTYRTDIGVALTAGYYSSSLDMDMAYTQDIPDLGAYLGNAAYNGLSLTANRTDLTTVDNDGFFFGAAYGRPLSDRTGIFVRLGYQDSDVEETLSGTGSATIAGQLQDLSYPAESYDYSGDALVYGIGGYWAATETISLNFFYEVKDYSYSDDNNTAETAYDIEEEQSMFGVTLRYSI